jgi:hypothetical protein
MKGYFVPMAKSKLNIPLPHVTAEEALRIVKFTDKVTKEFEGQLDELEAALGMYLMGRLVGWRVLVLIHNKRTLRKYEQVLGIDIREEFDETGPFTAKSLGYELAQKLDKFWKAVSGEVPLEDRRVLQKS